MKKPTIYSYIRWTAIFSIAVMLSVFPPGKLAAQIVFNGSETIANTTTLNSQQNPSVAVDTSGKIIIAWESEGTDGDDFGIYASVFNADGSIAVAEFLVNSTTANSQRYPSVACDADGNFTIVWMSDSQDGDGWGIYARKYSIAGAALSSQFRVNDSTAGDQKFPHISVNSSGNTIITWMTNQSGDFDISAKIYDNSATVLAGEFTVNTYLTGYQGYSRAAIREDGISTLVWQSEDQDSSGQGVFAQRINLAGAMVGSEFLVNTDTAGNQQEPDIDITYNGDFVIVWSSFGQDGDHRGVFAQRYDSSATVISGEFQVNTTTSYAQGNPAVCLSDSGNFAVLWNSYAQDGSYEGVYGRAYSANGSNYGSETLVNTRTTDFQQFPEAAFKKNDYELVAVWQDGLRNDTATHDSSNYGVYFQRLDVSDTIAPVAICQNITVYLNASGTASITASDIDGGSSDNSGTIALSVTPAAFTCSNLGTNTVTLTVTDAADNSASCSATVTVEDTISPTAICQDITVYLDGVGSANFIASDLDNGSTDNCVSVSLSASTTTFSCTDAGTQSVTLTATDGSGNASTCVSTVTVSDTTSPSAICQNIDVFLDGTGSIAIAASDLDGGSSDNCTTFSLSASTTTLDCNDLGSVSITLTVTDNSGNTSSCLSTVTVFDTTAPTAVCQNITVHLDGSGSATIAATDIDGGSSDNCNSLTYSTSVSSFDCNAIGSNSTTLTISDVSGNSASCVATVTVVDTTAPTTVCQNITTYLDASGNTSFLAADLDGGTSDNCVSFTLSASDTAFTCTDAGVQSVTLTATDGSGNTGSCVASVTVSDTIAPTAVCQNITVFLDGSGNTTITASDIDGGSADNCVTVTLSASATSFTCSDIGAQSSTLTVTDNAGNSSTCVATITVSDTTAPAAVCQNITAHLDGSGSATIVASDLDGGSTDNCSVATLSASTTSFDCNALGSNAVTLTVSDGSGNASTCTATVTVEDTIVPTAVCQSLTAYLDGSGSTTFVAADLDGGTSDNCVSFTLAASDTAFSCTDLGAQSVTLTATDGSGNSSSCVATVTVTDSIAPTATCQNITAYLDGSGNTSFTASDLDGGSTDNCVTVSLSASATTFTCNDLGAQSVVLTVTDGSVNTSSCTATVTVLDTIAPTAVCQNVTAYLDGLGAATITLNDLDGGSSDNCVSLILSATDTVFDCQQIGTNTITLTATDGSGNSQSCTATVTVLDTIAPTAICQNITVYLDGSGSATIVSGDVDGGSLDNCSSSVQTISTSSFSCNAIGAQTVTLTLTDSSGNASSCNSIVTVEDSTAPTPLCQNITVYLDGSGSATILAGDLDNGSTDNCTVDTVTASQTTFDCSDAGSVSVVLTVSDVNGNSSTCTSVVTVIDSIAPLAICQDITVYLDGSGNATLSGSDLDNGSTDECAPVSFSASNSTFGCSDIGINTLTLTVADPSGNTAICTSLVTVEDTIAPTAVCANPIVSLDNTGNATITTLTVEGGSSDNCAIDSMSIDISSFTCLDLGVQSVTLSLTDSSGNASACTSMVTIIDDLAPTVTCQPDTVYLDTTGNASITATQLIVSESDNCGIAGHTLSQSSFTALDLGANSILVITTDSSGNADTCISIVTVIDTLADAIDPGFSGLDPSLNWEVWPNPSRDEFHVDIHCAECIPNQEYTLMLTDLSGKVLLRKQVRLVGNNASELIDLRPYASGVFMLSLHTDRGLATKKVVKL